MRTKETKGMTLTTLVITIVVLSILAGVSIDAVLGDNGIIKAREVAKKSAQEIENDLRAKNELSQVLEKR